MLDSYLLHQRDYMPMTESQRRWVKANPAKVAGYRDAHRKRNADYRKRENLKRYGITLEQYNILASDGCRICGKRHDLCCDHDHVTGKLRGILCRSCNRGIGLLQDNPVLLRAATQYLMESV